MKTEWPLAFALVATAVACSTGRGSSDASGGDVFENHDASRLSDADAAMAPSDATALDASPDATVLDAAPSDAGSSDADIAPPPVLPGNPCMSRYPTIYGGSGTAASQDCTFTFGGYGRSYRLHIPPNFRAGSSALVLSLHGQGGTSAYEESATGWTIKSDAVGFAVAYPQAINSGGHGTLWNAYYDAALFSVPPPDDAAFLHRVITDLLDNVHPDPRRVYVTGMSSGALMANRVGVEDSDVVAAIGPVSGQLGRFRPGTPTAPPSPAHPISAVFLNGDADTSIPYCGGTFGMGGHSASVDETFGFWSTAAGCTGAVPTGTLCTGLGGTPTALTSLSATGCMPGFAVQTYRLIRGIHTFYTTPMNDPSGTPFNPAFDTSTGITTVDIVWNFFEAHPR